MERPADEKPGASDKLQALIDEHDDYEVIACHGTITKSDSLRLRYLGNWRGYLNEVILIDIDVQTPANCKTESTPPLPPPTTVIGARLSAPQASGAPALRMRPRASNSPRGYRLHRQARKSSFPPGRGPTA